MSDERDATTARSGGFSMGRAALTTLLAGSAFLLVTVLSFFWASNAGDDSLSATDPQSTASQVAGESDDVAASVAMADADVADAGATNSASSGPGSFVIDPADPATIVGSVTTVDGSAVADSPVHLFLAEENLPVGEIRHTTRTGSDGMFEISAPVGCYVIRFDPPAGRSVVGGNPHVDVPTCIDATIVRIQLDAQVL